MSKKAPEQLRFAVVAVDAAIFSFIEEQLVVLLMPINLPPHYANTQGFPGGIITPKETTEQAVQRVLKAKVGVVPDHIEQLATFSRVDRDKRNRVVSVGYLGFLRPEQVRQYEKTQAGGYFIPIRDIVQLAYDHNEVLDTALSRLRGKLSYTTIAQFLLPRRFTLTELQLLYEAVHGKGYDKRNFRKKILALDIIEDTGETQEGVRNRPAALYTFTTKKLTQLPLLL